MMGGEDKRKNIWDAFFEEKKKCIFSFAHDVRATKPKTIKRLFSTSINLTSQRSAAARDGRRNYTWYKHTEHVSNSGPSELVLKLLNNE